MSHRMIMLLMLIGMVLGAVFLVVLFGAIAR